MVPSNNLSILPWYTSPTEQDFRKWWAYGHVYPLFASTDGTLPPFQLIVNYAPNINVTNLRLYTKDGVFVKNGVATSISHESFAELYYSVLYYRGISSLFGNNLPVGQYYAQMTVNSVSYYSEVFSVVPSLDEYLKLEWWDEEDFVMDAGAIVYKNAFRNVVYLCTDIARPEYDFEDTIIQKGGYSFPVEQISKKRYKFSFLASEYMLDVMRFIRMADHVSITKDGKIYSVDTFMITPEWEGNGDMASVVAEFTTATVAKKIGVGYIKAGRGAYNDDFNDDFDNQ